MGKSISKQSAKQIAMTIVGDISNDPNLSASEYIKKYWAIYESSYPNNQNINGKVFEELIAICLIRAKVLPFYMQAKVAFIPNVNYDFIIYTNDIGPIALSAKTSLRERWKQADLEAVAMKFIHRKSKSFVITMSATEVKTRRVDPSQMMGLDGYVLANTKEFDDFISELQKHDLSLSPRVDAVSSHTVITRDNSKERYSRS